MSGALVLAAEAALRSGAGLVTVAAAGKAAEVVDMRVVEAMTLKVAGGKNDTISRKAVPQISDFIKKKRISAVVLGNGMGVNASLLPLCRSVINTFLPVVIDADGLNNISQDIKILGRRNSPLVLTPHQGEFMRLLGKSPHTKLDAREGKKLAQSFALKYNLILVLKSHKTLVTDGKRFFENKRGNPGMATAGVGDVLAGVIGAFIAQGLDMFSAAKYGVYIHSRAADLAAREKGELSLIASDIIDYLPLAIKSGS